MGVGVLKIRTLVVLGSIAALQMGTSIADGWVPIVPPGTQPYTTKAPLSGSIKNTRHNLTLSYNKEAGGAGIVMDTVRNNYGEVCVYCHTPHGANTQIKAPIWNRTINTGTYTIYDKLRTLDRPIGQPGPNSLTCLSCHDGTISIDSIINMPGSGGWNPSQMTVVDKTWLDTWNPSNKPQLGHVEMGVPIDDPNNPPSQTGAGNKCTLCHNTTDSGLPDFKAFVIGTNLQNDHPIGILFPDTFGPGVDFNSPTGNLPGKMKYFDKNGNNYPDKNEPRMYDTGEGPEVECASCHDPHGIPTGGAGSQFIPSFLRVSNGNVNTGDGTSSGLCLTCHEK